MGYIAAWSVGKHRIEVSSAGELVRVLVDDVDQRLAIHPRLLGEWPLRVGKRNVQLVRVRNFDVARTELWVDGQRVPPAELSIPWQKAPDQATCERHGSIGSESHGAASPPLARVTCGVCDRSVCRDCLSVDGVRCQVCFDEAVRAMEKQLRGQRLLWPLVGVALGVLMAAFGLAESAPRLVTAGGSLTVLTIGLVVYGLYRERVEARKRQARREAATGGSLPPS
jgi:hypothetical protein